MIKNKASALWSTIKGLTIFDKLNLLIVVIFFICALLVPIATISPISSDKNWEIIHIFSQEHRKTTIIILFILAINAGMSINSKFKSWFLSYTGVGNDIYARFFQKWVIFTLLIFFWEIIIHMRDSLTQTINLSWWYYCLWWLLIIWLCVDFLFLQRNYKTSSTYNHIKHQAHTKDDVSQESEQHTHQTFKNLFEE